MSFFDPLPGETPIDDISGLKHKGITLRKELSVLEGANILKAAEIYLFGILTPEKAPFDYTWALQLHREMFGEVWAWAGIPRGYETNIGIPPRQIAEKLYDLFQRLPYWADADWVTQAAMLHHEAVSIHPFPNGNGRWSRMLANIWLRLNGQPWTRWPEEAVGEASVIRTEYLTAIRAADGGEYGPLVGLHQRFSVPAS